MVIELDYSFDYHSIIIEKKDVINNILDNYNVENYNMSLPIIKFLLLFILDTDNVKLPLMKDDSFIKDLLSVYDYEKYYSLDKEKTNHILSIINKYRINKQLNKKIALLYSNYINSKEPNFLTRINIEKLELFLDSID